MIRARQRFVTVHKKVQLVVLHLHISPSNSIFISDKYPTYLKYNLDIPSYFTPGLEGSTISLTPEKAIHHDAWLVFPLIRFTRA